MERTGKFEEKEHSLLGLPKAVHIKRNRRATHLKDSRTSTSYTRRELPELPRTFSLSQHQSCPYTRRRFHKVRVACKDYTAILSKRLGEPRRRRHRRRRQHKYISIQVLRVGIHCVVRVKEEGELFMRVFFFSVASDGPLSPPGKSARRQKPQPLLEESAEAAGAAACLCGESPEQKQRLT